MVFSGAAMVAGAASYAFLGFLGSFLPTHGPGLRGLLLVLGGVWSLLWYVAPRRVPLPSTGRQVNRRLVGGAWIGPAIFGAVLGIGLLTVVVTPLLWAGAIGVIALGAPLAGAVFGVAFGLGRTLDILVQGLRWGDDPGRLADRVVGQRLVFRWVGLPTSAVVVALGLGMLRASL